jgi:hypothetical protein
VRVRVTPLLYRRVDSTQALNRFILTALEIELLFQILTNQIQANSFLISKSFVQLSSQDPKFLVPVERRNSTGDAQFPTIRNSVFALLIFEPTLRAYQLNQAAFEN